ncbi:FAD-dependent oxidoreductase [Nocardioides hwasunensis]|uniref:FAD-dependent monooxygenase n=1 Tax=Nocardioides hwasunensis TaxID=397258 RepID=A0ABR8MH85_9ACTN|nr:FAD-dependent oxidoreductase [Nocardioides hwasunensis]MBD3914122.1 FAD-dependent monooxygenase [Nocardioides hwasunensis]
MSNRLAVVSGASIAGLSAAYWLRRTGWDVVVVERAPEFRDGGQNVDVRGVAREVLRRMDLFDAVKALNTTETGTVFVDEDGEVTAELPSDGTDGATAELEILRGDFAQVLRDHLPDGVEIVFDDAISTVDDVGGAVSVTTAAGQSWSADLLVVAEGVRSRTRDLVFDDVERHPLGVNMAFGTIARTPSDDRQWRWHTTTEGRQVHLRPDNHGTTRAMLAYRDDDDLAALDRDDALAALRERYEGVGWEAPRILDGLDDSDDVYLDSLTQIRMESWHRGRVVVSGDAAWCVTPMGGGGASLALTSGYVLAASLAEHPDDLEAAFAAYDEWMRPLVDDVQTIPKAVLGFAYPQTRLGLALRGLADKVMTSAPVKPLVEKMMSVADTDRELPAMPVTLA